jgi:hypothetical protein
MRKVRWDNKMKTLKYLSLALFVGFSAKAESCKESELVARHSYDDKDEKDHARVIVKTINFPLKEYSEESSFEAVELMGGLKDQALKNSDISLQVELILGKETKTVVRHEFVFEKLAKHLVSKGLNVKQLVDDQESRPKMIVFRILDKKTAKLVCETAIPVIPGD